jgi:hypothetical protein
MSMGGSLGKEGDSVLQCAPSRPSSQSVSCPAQVLKTQPAREEAYMYRGKPRPGMGASNRQRVTSVAHTRPGSCASKLFTSLSRLQGRGRVTQSASVCGTAATASSSQLRTTCSATLPLKS